MTRRVGLAWIVLAAAVGCGGGDEPVAPDVRDEAPAWHDAGRGTGRSDHPGADRVRGDDGACRSQSVAVDAITGTMLTSFEWSADM